MRNLMWWIFSGCFLISGNFYAASAAEGEIKNPSKCQRMLLQEREAAAAFGLELNKFDRKFASIPRTIDTILTVRRPLSLPEAAQTLQLLLPPIQMDLIQLKGQARNLLKTSVASIRKDIESLLLTHLNVAYYQLPLTTVEREKALQASPEVALAYTQIKKVIAELDAIVLAKNKNEASQVNLAFYNERDIHSLITRYHDIWDAILNETRAKVKSNYQVMGEIFTRNMSQEQVQTELYNTLMVRFHGKFIEKLAEVINASDFFTAQTFIAAFTPYGEIPGIKLGLKKHPRALRANDPVEWKTLWQVMQQIYAINPQTEIIFSHEQQFFQIAPKEKFHPITNHYFARLEQREYHAPLFDIPFNVLDRKEDTILTMNRLQKDLAVLQRYTDLAQGARDYGQLFSTTAEGPRLLWSKDVRYDNGDNCFRFALDELWRYVVLDQNIALNASDMMSDDFRTKMNDLKRKNLRRLNIWPQLAHDYLAKLQQVIQGQKDDELAIRFYANGKNGNQVLVIVDATFLALHKIRPDFKVPAKSFAYMFNLPAPAMAFGKIKLPTAENVSLPYDDVLAKKVLPILRPQIEQQIAQVLAQIEQDFNIAPITVNPPSETYQEMDVVQSTL